MKHFDIPCLIRSSEQLLLRKSISIRITYTFMWKMYGKLPLGPFLFPNLWFPLHLVLLYFSMYSRTSKADLFFLASIFQPQSLKETNTSQTSNYLCMSSTRVLVVKWHCLKGRFERSPRSKVINTYDFFFEAEMRDSANNLWRPFFMKSFFPLFLSFQFHCFQAIILPELLQ